MRENGYPVEVENVEEIVDIRNKYQVPTKLQSCHTAIVDGYIIEGHVPVESIERLFAERPDIIGLAVPGMPPGSPGMEVASGAVQPFDVMAFDSEGNSKIYDSYPK